MKLYTDVNFSSSYYFFHVFKKCRRLDFSISTFSSTYENCEEREIMECHSKCYNNISYNTYVRPETLDHLIKFSEWSPRTSTLCRLHEHFGIIEINDFWIFQKDKTCSSLTFCVHYSYCISNLSVSYWKFCDAFRLQTNNDLRAKIKACISI